MSLAGTAQKEGPEAYLADATLYLELFGLLVAGWQLLRQGIAASALLVDKPDDTFLNGKLTVLNYFFEYEIPKTEGLITRLKSEKRITTTLQEAELD
jgi:butyryl-CoA dehydrogenase